MWSMNSPFCHDASNIMTIKRKINRKKLNKDVKKVERDIAKIKISKPKTPFADAGHVVGRAVGAFTGIPYADKIGRWLGSGIGSIFGSGDYEMVGGPSKYNVLAGSPPQFSSTRSTNIVCHREYLGDITGTAAFQTTLYPLNPGLAGSFPWLANVAANYQQYRIHGMVFEFKSLITDFVAAGSPGVVVMATNYNADVPGYSSRQQMENSEFAVSVKPTVNLMHMIECASQQTVDPIKFVRTGSVPAGQDLRLYDQGLFQFATQANPVIDLGELWVTYCVEFFKPLLVPGVDNQGLHTYRGAADNAHPLGLVSNIQTGNIVASIAPTVIAFTGLVPGNQYYIDISWYAGAAAWTPPGLGITGGYFVAAFINNTQTEIVAPQAGVNCTSAALSTSFFASASAVNVTFGAMVIGAAAALDIFVSTDVFME